MKVVLRLAFLEVDFGCFDGDFDAVLVGLLSLILFRKEVVELMMLDSVEKGDWGMEVGKGESWLVFGVAC